MEINVTHIDTACCLLEIGDYRILTDPALDNAGKIYHHGYGAISKKTGNPKLTNSTLKKIDLILLSHPQHKDNFDIEGRKFAKSAPLILSTKKIEKEFSNGKGLVPWQTFELFLRTCGPTGAYVYRYEKGRLKWCQRRSYGGASTPKYFNFFKSDW